MLLYLLIVILCYFRNNGQNYTVYSSSITGNPGYYRMSSLLFGIYFITDFTQILSNKVYAKNVHSKLHYWMVFAALVSIPTIYSLVYHWMMDKQYPMTSNLE